MTHRAIPAELGAQEAAAVVRRRVPGAQLEPPELHHHPFVAVSFEVEQPPPRGWGRWRRRTQSGGPRQGRVHTLVDARGGRCYLTGEWPAWESRQTVRGPAATVSVPDAVARARDTVATQLLRVRRLAAPPTIRDGDVVELVWKPNWLVRGRHRGRDLQVLVDGVDGSHYVVSG